MTLYVADDPKARPPLLAVRDVGGAFPQAADHTPAVSHGAHRLGNHATGGDASPPRARRADSLPLHVAPVLFDFTPPSGRPFGIQVTRRQEGPDRGHGKRPASNKCNRRAECIVDETPGAFGGTSFHLVRYMNRASGTTHAARQRASDARFARKAPNPLSTPARVWPRNGLHLQRITKGNL